MIQLQSWQQPHQLDVYTYIIENILGNYFQHLNNASILYLRRFSFLSNITVKLQLNFQYYSLIHRLNKQHKELGKLDNTID
jgi:hypothetical protein